MLDLTNKHKEYKQKQDESKYLVWERMLDQDEWQAVQQTLTELPDRNKREINKKIKLQFLFSTLYFLGLRIEELSSHPWSAFRMYNNSWWFFVRGKGDKLGHIPINDKLLSFIKTYRISLGKSPLPDSNELDLMFVSAKTNKSVSTRQLYNLVKEVGEIASNKFDESIKKQKLKRLSPHWLRHLSASHQDRLGISAGIIQKNLRHKSRQTTDIYLHQEDDLRHAEMQKMDFSVTNSVKDQTTTDNRSILTITLTEGPADVLTALSRFIDVCEQEILKGFEWKREDFNKKDLLFNLQQRYSRKTPICVNYTIINLTEDQSNLMIKQVIKQAYIRLFKAFCQSRNYTC